MQRRSFGVWIVTSYVVFLKRWKGLSSYSSAGMSLCMGVYMQARTELSI